MRRRKIDWLNLVLEFIVILIGILIAFQLNEYAISKGQRKVLQEHYANLVMETENNLNNLNNALENVQKVDKNADSLLYLIENKADLQTINNLSLSLLDVGGAYMTKNAYEALVNSGDIRFIKDYELKSKTVNLYEYYKWVKSFDDFGIEQFNLGYYKYYKENMDLYKYLPQQRKVYEDKFFLNAIGVYRFSMSGRIRKYKECIDVADQYLEFIKEKVK